MSDQVNWNGYLTITVPDMLTNYEREPKGIPIGRAPTVNLRNNHTQYIFTWHVSSSLVYRTTANIMQVRIKFRHFDHVLDGGEEAVVRYSEASTTQR